MMWGIQRKYYPCLEAHPAKKNKKQRYQEFIHQMLISFMKNILEGWEYNAEKDKIVST